VVFKSLFLSFVFLFVRKISGVRNSIQKKDCSVFRAKKSILNMFFDLTLLDLMTLGAWKANHKTKVEKRFSTSLGLNG